MKPWLPIRFWRLVMKQLTGRLVRTGLTVAGVGIGLMLFVVIEGMQQGVREATMVTENDTTLVVYRENRYCPATSILPEIYQSRIERIDGVVRAEPIQVVVINCRASLDVITFRGMTEEDFIRFIDHEANIVSGTRDAWLERNDAAFLGKTLAKRRNLGIGDRFEASGYQVTVAGILDTDRSGYNNLAFVHLPYLQYSGRDRQGRVTQFNVVVDDPERMDEVADQIDALFRSDQAPTDTRAERAFVADVAGDIIEIVQIIRYLGWACLAAVIALICNAMILNVQDRVTDNAVLQTLGYSRSLIFKLVIGEGIVIGLVGGVIGSVAAISLLMFVPVNLSVEGISIPITAGVGEFSVGLVMALLIGILAGIVPAVRASRRDLVSCFRTI
ncbi:MAG: hypothetical protein CMJ32_06210 [Phycisphaerae bacterium]|nr:hypothetical protein [Phycisphaerae bacterium]